MSVRLFPHPAGFDVRLARRVEASAGGARIHAVARIVEDYRAACSRGDNEQRLQIEARLRALLPFESVYWGMKPLSRRGQPCRVLAKMPRAVLIQFADGVTGSARPCDVSPRRADPAQHCLGCGPVWQVSVIGGYCPDCRAVIASEGLPLV